MAQYGISRGTDTYCFKLQEVNRHDNASDMTILVNALNQLHDRMPPPSDVQSHYGCPGPTPEKHLDWMPTSCDEQRCVMLVAKSFKISLLDVPTVPSVVVFQYIFTCWILT